MVTITITPVVKDIGSGMNIVWNNKHSEFLECGDISSITIKRDFLNRIKLLINLKKHVKKSRVEIEYQYVTKPVTSTATELKDILFQYNKGFRNVETVTATGGSKLITATYELSNNIIIIINGVAYKPSSYSYTVGKKDILFNLPFTGGEYVTIINL